MTKVMTKRLMKKSKEAALPLAVDMVAFAVPCLIPRRQLGSLPLHSSAIVLAVEPDTPTTFFD